MSKMKIVLVGCAMLVALTTVASAEREGCPHGCLGSPAVTECPVGPNCLNTPPAMECPGGVGCYAGEGPNGGRGRVSGGDACPTPGCISPTRQQCPNGSCRVSMPASACPGPGCSAAAERRGGPGPNGGSGATGDSLAAERQAPTCPVQPCGAVVR
jgi:hypothetical protein